MSTEMKEGRKEGEAMLRVTEQNKIGGGDGERED